MSITDILECYACAVTNKKISELECLPFMSKMGHRTSEASEKGARNILKFLFRAFQAWKAECRRSMETDRNPSEQIGGSAICKQTKIQNNG